jgi:uncharacterized protein (DUF1015 family)
MTDVRPFCALRYDPDRVELGRVIVPPYDVVADEDRAGFYERDPHNAIRLELTRDAADEAHTDYSEVRRTLDGWSEEGILRHDAEPAFYGLRQSFTAPDGARTTREGFFALLHLEDYARRIVRPHERTLAGPKADRLKMLRAARANLSPIFFLYEDREGVVPELLAPAFAEGAIAPAEDETGAVHRLGRLTGAGRAQRIAGFLSERPVVIADGHHRYETALAYRDECREAGQTEGPAEWVLGYFANAYAPGTLLLPIHRLVLKGEIPTEAAWRERLPGWREERIALDDAADVPELLARHLEPLAAGQHAFAADDASGALRIFSSPKRDGDELTVRRIHREVIDGVFGLDEAAVREGAIAYPKSAVQTARDLRRGRGAVALYLNALSPDDVFRVTAAGEVLPQKSTFFYPKLPSGLVFRELGAT